MNFELIIWLTGIMLLAYWLVYAMGEPNQKEISKVDVGGILFGLPLWLADRRLKQHRLRDGIDQDYIDAGSLTDNPIRQKELKDAWKENRYDWGRKFFTWERSITCPICLHWWLSVIFGVICLSLDLLNAREEVLLAGFIYLANHLIIRKIA